MICSFLWDNYFLSQHTWYIVMGEALGIHQGGATHIFVLWGCLWGRGQRGHKMPLAWLLVGSVTSPTTHKQIGPFWCCFLSGWVCVHSRTLWVSPTKSPMRLGVSPTAASTPTGFFSQRFEALFPPCWNPALRGLSCSPVVPPSLSAYKCGTTCSTSCRLACPGPPATFPCILSPPAAHLCPS